MALGSNLAGVARVAFEAQTATFYAELKPLRADIRRRSPGWRRQAPEAARTCPRPRQRR